METKTAFFKYKNYIIDLAIVHCAYIHEINPRLVICTNSGNMVEIFYEFEADLKDAYRKLCNALIKYTS